MSAAHEGMLIPPGGGRTIRVLAGRVTFKIHSAESDGELVWRLGDRTVSTPAGSFLVIPRGVIHGFANERPEPARMFVLTSPGGFEGFMAGLADLIEASPTGTPDPAKFAALAREYDTEFLE